MAYTPFNKEIEELTEKDLLILADSEISEGWYIEYKRDIPKTSSGHLDGIKISKSVSAFANTKGGWIFWGIDCDNKNKVNAINGVDLSEQLNFEDQVAKTINANISPRPYYHFKRIGLENGRTVFLILVEESPTPPYITSQGVIYQREHNESKPIRERYIIEKLNEKTGEYYDSIERFTSFDLPETKGQAEWNQTYLELYLYPLPFNSFEFKEFYTSDFFKNAALRFYQNVDVSLGPPDSNAPVIPLNLGFNSIFSSERSLIIRPLNEKNLIYKSTTVELTERGNLKFLMPVYEFDTRNVPKHYEGSETLSYLLDKYSPHETVKQSLGYPMKYSSELLTVTQRKTTDFVNHVKFIDGMELIASILIIISKYRAVLEDNGFDFGTDIGFRARITDCWRKFVFFDNKDYLEKIKLYNIPLSPKNEIEIPEFRKGSGYKLKLDHSTFFDIARFILEGIGLPDSHSIPFSEIIDNGFKRFNHKE